MKMIRGAISVLAITAIGLLVFHAHAKTTRGNQSKAQPFKAGGVRSFEIVPLETVSETSSNASIGDLNGDGHPDIVLVKGRHWQVTSLVFFGDGKGHFTPGPPLPSNANKTYSANLADMTKSGHLDMVLSADEPDPKMVLVNDGKGNFTVGGTYGNPKWSTRNAAVGDLNGDGFPDIAVANRGMASYVCFNDGKLHFDCRPLKDSPSAATVAIGDIDGDGANDVIYACRDSCQSAVYFNGGKGNVNGKDNFDRKEFWGPPNSSTRAMAVADFNGDGHLDIAACHEKLGCFVYLNDGHGHFGAGIKFQEPAALPYSMIAADLNRDGRPEIIVGYVEAPGTIYFNDGTGTKFQPVPFGDGKGAIYGMAAGDLDGDGWPDVVAARSDAPSFVMFNRPPKK
ncbi:MAG TPA: VCBS repeat-containing protein [Candidatus Acidoferrales bacterium]